MNGSIKLKLVLSLIALALIATAVSIPVFGFTRAAPYVGPKAIASGIVPTPTGPPPKPTPPYEQANWTIQEGIPYATLPFGTFLLNIYTPKPAPQGNTPIVLFFHGCCNPATNRDNALRLGHTPADPHEYMFRELLNNGYQVATLDFPSEYPIVNAHGAEAGKAAVRFFRANAATYKIDPTRIIAWASSAGGWIASIMGTADKSAGLDIGQYLNYSSRVEGVLDWFGLADLQYITSDDAPFLIQVGTHDDPMVISISKALFNALIKAHVFVQLQWVLNAGHKFVSKNGSTNPDYQGIANTAITFLNAMVRDNPNPQPQ